ncbi:MAG TPA: hypothetical protein VFA89_08050 [Terriglobales bacterium]|nr:hypothetical protein [Terriglobales bacterium]
MRKTILVSVPLLMLLILSSLLVNAAEPVLQPLPKPLAANAVASLKLSKQGWIFSFMGLGAGKTWKDITKDAWQMSLDTGKWEEIRPVPGPAGRLDAAAIGVREQVFLFSGYVVDGRGAENPVPDVNIYEPLLHRWYRGADIPVAVGGAVIGSYRDRYIYLVGGRSKEGPVKNVQVYDVEKDSWRQATAIAGEAVFGAGGALLDDTIFYVNGAYRNPSDDSSYVASDECWAGKIDHHDPTKVQWTKLANHPGNARYGIAAGSSPKDQKIYFSGGSDDPYNYNGLGYNGKPVGPSPMTFAWNLRASKWEVMQENTANATLDNRALVVIPAALVTIGGIAGNQEVTARVNVISKQNSAR